VKTCALLLSVLWFANAASAAPSLYERLGGDAGVHAIANALIDRVSADPRHGMSFEDVNLKRLKRLLAEQLCELSGGPCKYSGSPMRESHAGLHITEADFYDMVAVLRDVLKERRVDQRSTNELLKILAPMKRDIVEHQRPAPPPVPTEAPAAAPDGAVPQPVTP
jgi:hemoglobin